MKRILLFLTAILITLLFVSIKAGAQQYKLRQVRNMNGMKIESTIYVKGMRQRIENATSMMPGGMNLITIEQCDLKRTIKINDQKKVYMIVPFVTIQQAEEPVEVRRDVSNEKTTRKGGVINMWYNIKDTGERKKIYGFTARHIWTTYKMIPSADACNMKDSMVTKTDGWYIDLPEFNCPQHYSASGSGYGDGNKPDCIDKMVPHMSGKGKLGFPIEETTVIIAGGESHEMRTSLETIEISTAKLDSTLFIIPPGYKEVHSEQEFNSMNAKDFMNNMIKDNQQSANMNPDQKSAGKIRVGVFMPSTTAAIEPQGLQQYLVGLITDQNIEAIAVNNQEDVLKYQCDYSLNAAVTDVSSPGKAAGILKAIKNRDVLAGSTYNVHGTMILKAKDGSEKMKKDFDGKFEGTATEAARKGLQEGWSYIFYTLK
jgi:hypothetical protein